MRFEIDFEKVLGINSNSKEIKPNYIFVAIKGEVSDGHKYIEKAIENGASIIVHQDDVIKNRNINYIKVEDARIALSELSALVYPKQPKYILGVTGTSGKSSTVNFVREILKLLNKKAISVGSLGVLGDLEIKSSLTTPPTEVLHQILQNAKEKEIEYVAIECSSHGIEQHRVSSLNFSACGFTNFTQDHLDYHHTMEEYFAAKMKLFSLMKPGFVVLNKDIDQFKDILRATAKHEVISYGKSEYENAKHNIVIKNVILKDNKQKIDLNIDKVEYQTEISVLGEFQVYNLACAIGLLMSTGISAKSIMDVVPLISTVPGRLELVGNYNGANIFVDYAHKPDALLNVLQNTRRFTQNKLLIVFGCGGDRDAEKRPLMGEIATSFADFVIITDDNPRTEDPKAIRQSIVKGCNQNFIEISDREEAIKYAVSRLVPGDNLIIAGKGHETYQIVGKEVFHFSDQEIVQKYINQAQ